MGIGAGYRRIECAGRLGGDAGGEADRSLPAVIVTGSEHTCAPTPCSVDGNGVGQTELCQVEGCIVLRGTRQANQMVDDLGGA
jgi:hypothetical protein